MLSTGWSKNLTRTLIDVTLENDLEGLRVSIRVEVHGGVDALLSIEGVEIILDDGGLTSTGGTNVKDSLVNRSVDILSLIHISEPTRPY